MIIEVIKLKRAKARIEKGWCQNHLGEAVDGTPLTIEKRWFGTKWWRLDEAGHYENPAKYCMRGSLLTAAPTTKSEHLLVKVAGQPLTMFNDSVVRTKEEVLATFDQAIVLAKQQMPWYERALCWMLCLIVS
jgi:hypothetical protein